jgi:ParB-like nuclease domain
MNNELTFVALNKFVRSSLNVRKTGADSIDDLAASIAVHGLLQNLTVTRKSATGKTKSKADTYEVMPVAAGWPRSNPWQSSRRFPKTTRFRAKL